MRNNPYVNAILASVYIAFVAYVMTSLERSTPRETVLIPMFVLSLFVLSAAIMGYLFMYQPFRLYFEDRKNEAVVFFLKTLGTFAVIVALFFFLLLYMTP